MNFTINKIMKIYNLPFNDLISKAHKVHKNNFNHNEVQLSTLLNIKKGLCPEDCKYCSQSISYNTGLENEKLMDISQIIQSAKCAKENNATRFCMAAAWKIIPKKDLNKMLDIVKEVKKLGLETCMTLGSLTLEEAILFKEAGLDYYNHNLDTSKNYYPKVITTRTFEDRLKTLENLRKADLKTCCGAILGLGEELEDRFDLLCTLANMTPQPESVPINLLVKIKGTPFENNQDIDVFDFIRIISVARIIMPKSYIRLSAGRKSLSEEALAFCYFVGANSIHYGENLLTTKNLEMEEDNKIFKKLGINSQLYKRAI